MFRIATFVFVFLSGFCIAWFVKPELQLIPLSDMGSADQVLVNTSPRQPSGTDQIIPLHRASELGAPKSSAPSSVQSQAHSEPSIEPIMAVLRQLLVSARYDAAIQLYSEHEQNRSPQAGRLKAYIVKHLEGALGNDEIFIDLSEAYLGYYYSDIDVLMLVAEFNQLRANTDEALRSLDLAYRYSQNESERARVRAVLNTVVSALDLHLRDEQNWSSLYDIYRLLLDLDLGVSSHRFAFAEMSQRIGDVLGAEHAYRQLAEDPEWRVRAEAAIKALEGGEQRGPTDFDTQIQLQRMGQHFIAVLVLNETDSLNLIVDTGASVSSISRETFSILSSSNQLVFQGERLFNTAGGVSRGEVYRSDSMNVGGYIFEGANLVVMDIPASPHHDGLLGMNVLKHFRFQIDQDEALLKLSPR